MLDNMFEKKYFEQLLMESTSNINLGSDWNNFINQVVMMLAHNEKPAQILRFIEKEKELFPFNQILWDSLLFLNSPGLMIRDLSGRLISDSLKLKDVILRLQKTITPATLRDLTQSIIEHLKVTREIAPVQEIQKNNLPPKYRNYLLESLRFLLNFIDELKSGNAKRSDLAYYAGIMRENTTFCSRHQLILPEKYFDFLEKILLKMSSGITPADEENFEGIRNCMIVLFSNLKDVDKDISSFTDKAENFIQKHSNPES